MTSTSLEMLRQLGASRWTVPVMALLWREAGSRFAPIARRLGVPANSLTRCLEQLEKAGWMIPNPGHGHPLRPEYVLTSAGETVGALCDRIWAARERLGLAAGDLPRWGLPVAAELSPGSARFGALQARLDPVTPRALSQALQAMIRRDLVGRRIENRFPLAPLYELTVRGQELAGAVTG
jgi:DNA-binding HxlR family transcriptional regulator